MENFTIFFQTSPWLLLLLIPALLLTLIPYFRLARKYRRTRNRITSMVLHLIIMVLSVSVLSGLTFAYDTPNVENEIILLVDKSHSNNEFDDEKDEFIKAVLDESDSLFQVGVVTFGYNQVYAAEMSNNTNRVYSQYLNSPDPDDSATDIASALYYARDLFKSPKTAKIVLITDGIETDGDVTTAIKIVAAEGITVDTVFYENLLHDEVMILNTTLPDYSVAIGDSFSISVDIQSSVATRASLTVYDNGVQAYNNNIELVSGLQTIELIHSYNEPGLHALTFVVDCGQDTLTQNNTYHSYMYLHVFDKILIVERNESESARLKALLDEEAYNVTVVDINNLNDTAAGGVPTTVEELQEYDQVILVNIARSDMPKNEDESKDFEKSLNRYVHDVGGGLLTVGGNESSVGDPKPHAYNRQDMYGSLYQQMLPVEATNYTPPLGVMIVIDCSGSMSSKDSVTGMTKLDLAKQGAKDCLYALSERDYCGVMAFDGDYSEEVKLIATPNQNQIIAAIEDIQGGGATIYATAIEQAGRSLSALRTVEKRHIMLVSDAQPGDRYEEYSEVIQRYYENNGITITIIGIGAGENENMTNAAALGNGTYYPVTEVNRLPQIMREALFVPEIKEIEYETFTPEIVDYTPVVSGVTQAEMPTLDGYYGTKRKDGASVPLMGAFVPIYAQWKYGEGMVGSFMCDLSGFWSNDFMTNPAGIRIINNIVSGLFPIADIRPKDMTATLDEDNYHTKVNVNTELASDQTVELTVTSPPGEYETQNSVQSIKPTAEEGFNTIRFEATQPGIHNVLLEKKNADGTLVSQFSTYKAFSYSAEYNVFVDPVECEAMLENIARIGKGVVASSARDVFTGDVVPYSHIEYDPRLLFLIIALVLFLLDIAVRKFKFKWIHEIIRDNKAKKMLLQEKD